MNSARATGLWILLALVVAGCAPNAAWRQVGEMRCAEAHRDCQQRDAGLSTERFRDFSVSFVEFSERGNVFDRGVYANALAQLRQDADAGAVIVVFVHGWKHNAAPDDGNVVEFREALHLLSQSPLSAGRRVHGLYIGWRGLSLYGLGSENLTFWDRKAAAEGIGKGGVTELLMDVEALTRNSRAGDRNLLLVVGHSFGAAVVLSALNEVLMDRLNAYADTLAAAGSGKRVPPPRFGNGVILLNPAIEANHVFQLKELSQRIGASGGSDFRPLHVISSRGDGATHVAFPLGQALGTWLNWSHAKVHREFAGQPYRFDEFELDRETIGNYDRFHTAHLVQSVPDDDPQADAAWRVLSLCDAEAQAPHHPRRSPIPCSERDPVAFVYTSPRFIRDHNDVFNARVLAYMSTTVSESLAASGRRDATYAACFDEARAFAFDRCYAHSLDLLSRRREAYDRAVGEARASGGLFAPKARPAPAPATAPDSAPKP